MKKRLLCAFLVICVTMNAVPMTSLAAQKKIKVSVDAVDLTKEMRETASQDEEYSDQMDSGQNEEILNEEKSEKETAKEEKANEEELTVKEEKTSEEDTTNKEEKTSGEESQNKEESREEELTNIEEETSEDYFSKEEKTSEETTNEEESTAEKESPIESETTKEEKTSEENSSENTKTENTREPAETDTMWETESDTSEELTEMETITEPESEEETLEDETQDVENTERIGADSFSNGMTLDNDYVVEGDVFLNTGTLDLNGHTLIIEGNLYQPGGTVDINSGMLKVTGDYRIQSQSIGSNGEKTWSDSYGYLKMINESDYLTVGEFVCQNYYSQLGMLEAGTMEVLGDFKQVKSSGSSYAFCSSDEHKVIFNGNGEEQNVCFENDDSTIANLEIGEKSNVVFSGYLNVTSLAGDVKFASDNIEIYGMNLSGHSLTVTKGDVWLKSGTFDIAGGKGKIQGNLYHSGGTLNLNKGILEVTGDYRLQSQTTNSNGEKVWSDSYGYLKMVNEEDHLLVDGFVYQSGYSQSSNLTAGTMEISGDFTQVGTNSSNSIFAPIGTHTVFLNNIDQTVQLDHSSSSFQNLYLAMQQDDYTFNRVPCWNNLVEMCGIGTGAKLEVTIEPPEGVSLYEGMVLSIQCGNNRSTRRITSRNTYYFSGLPIGESASVTLANISGDIIASTHTEKIQRGENKVVLNHFSETADLTVRIQDEKGNNVTEHATVEWLREDGSQYASGSHLYAVLSGSKLSCKISLDNTLGRQYCDPEPFDWVVSKEEKYQTITLKPFERVILTGTTVEDTRPITGASITVDQYLNGRYHVSTTAITDVNGKFRMEVYALPATLKVDAFGYITEEIELEAHTADYEVGEINLHTLEGVQLTLTASYTVSVKDNSSTQSENLRSLDDLSIEIYNETSEKEVKKAVRQKNMLVLPEGVASGDKLLLTVSSLSEDFETITCSTLVDDKGYASANLKLVQRGSLEITCKSSDNTKTRILIYDEAGKLVWTQLWKQGNIQCRGLSAGNYSVIAMGDSAVVAHPSSMEALQQLGLAEGQDYILSKSVITAGKVASVMLGAVPHFEEERYYFTEPEQTQFTLNKSQVTVGKYVTLYAKAPFQEKYMQRVYEIKWVLEIPEGCSYVEGTTSVDGVLCEDILVEDKRLVIPVADSASLLRLCIIAEKAGTCTVDGALEYMLDNKKVYQPIGSVELKTDEMTFEMCEKTSKKIVNASGTAMIDATISLYDNDVMVGQTKVGSSGRWSLDFELYKPYTYSRHQIYARVETADGKTLYTQTKNLLYQYMEEEISVSRVTMLYRGSKLLFDFNDPHQGGGLTYSYVPGDPSFTFIVEFDATDFSKIGNVQLDVKCSDGRIQTLFPVFDLEKKYWTVRADFMSNSLPTSVGVRYDLDADIVISMEEQAEVEAAWREYRESLTLIQVNWDDMPADDAELKDALDKCKKAEKNLNESNKNLISTYKRLFGALPQNENDFSFTTDMGTVRVTKKELTNKPETPNAPPNLDEPEGTLPKVYVPKENGNCTEIQVTGKLEHENLFTGIQAKEMIDCVEGEYNLQKTRLTVYKDTLKQYNKVLEERMKSPTIEESKKEKYKKNKIKIEGQINKLDKAFKVLDKISVGMGIYDLWKIKHQIQELQTIYNETVSAEIRYQCELLKNQLYAYAVYKIASTLLNLVSIANPALEAGVVLFDFFFGYYMDKYFEEQINMLKLKSLDAPKNPDYSQTYPGSSKTGIIDPSGFLYEAVPSNRLEGVRATCYEKVTKYDIYNEPYEEIQFWDASRYEQENPLITDREGQYAWDVPEGKWQIKYEKDGYETAYSDWIDVPPPRYDVNIGLVSYAPPKIETVLMYSDMVELVFSKYIKAASITNSTVRIISEGKTLLGTIELANAEENPSQAGEILVSRIRFIPEQTVQIGQTLTLKARQDIVSYAGIPMEQNFQITDVVKECPQQFSANEKLELPAGTDKEIVVEAAPATAVAGITVYADNLTPELFTLEENAVVLDEQGKARFLVHGEIQGEGKIKFTLGNTSLTTETQVVISMQERKAAVPEASVASGVIAEDTLVALGCATTGAEIYYTLDGTSPKESDTRKKYNKDTILIHRSCVLKAIAIAMGMEDSEEVQYEYIVDRGVFVPAESLILNKTDMALRKTGDKGILSVSQSPAKANSNLVWSSWDESIAKVENGLVTAVGKGITVIRVAAEDNANIYTECKVVVAGERESLFGEIIYLPNLGLWMKNIGDQEYTGKAIRPEIVIYDGGTLLKEGKDYAVSFSKNKNAGIASVKVSGKGNYKGKGNGDKAADIKFSIVPTDLKKLTISCPEYYAITNKKQSPTPKLTNGSVVLKNKKDYTVIYQDESGNPLTGNAIPKGAEGKFRMVITGKGNYIGEIVRPVQMVSNAFLLDRASVTLRSGISKQNYTGQEIRFDPADITVKLNKKTLQYGSDYTIDYKNNIDAGTAVVRIIPAEGSTYVGCKEKTFTIVGTPIKKIKIEGFSVKCTYTGKEIYQNAMKLVDPDSNNTLTENKDYLVTTSNNIHTGKATVTIKGMGRYSGILKKKFTITPYNIAADDAAISLLLQEQTVVQREIAGRKVWFIDEVQCYSKGGSKPKLSVKYGRQNIEGTLSYKNANQVTVDKELALNKQPCAIFTGTGDFTGKLLVYYNIQQADISEQKIHAEDVVYNQKAGKFKSNISLKDAYNGQKLKAGTDYEKIIKYTYAEGENAGSEIAGNAVLEVGTKILVTIAGSGNYSGIAVAEYEIVPASVHLATVKVKNQVYTGEKCLPKADDVTVKLGGRILKEGEDYLITEDGTDIINVGNRTFKIMGIGENYGGTKSVKFKIKQKSWLWWFLK